jgi:hypothetical protein
MHLAPLNFLLIKLFKEVLRDFQWRRPNRMDPRPAALRKTRGATDADLRI